MVGVGKRLDADEAFEIAFSEAARAIGFGRHDVRRRRERTQVFDAVGSPFGGVKLAVGT